MNGVVLVENVLEVDGSHCLVEDRSIVEKNMVDSSCYFVVGIVGCMAGPV